MNISILGLKCRVEIVIASIIVGFVIASFTICSCAKLTPEGCAKVMKESKGVVKEGFEKISDIANAASLNYQMGADDQGSWTQKALAYASDMGYNTVLSKHANYKGTEVPLQNTMFFFKNNAFKPECCPSTYSSSSGCAPPPAAAGTACASRAGRRWRRS